MQVSAQFGSDVETLQSEFQTGMPMMDAHGPMAFAYRQS